MCWREINSFSGPYRFLSNFYPAPIMYEGLKYPTSEHAFQAAKTLNRTQKLNISLAPTPGKAKRMGRMVTLRSDWDEVRIQVMYDILRLKFTQNSELGEQLVAIGDEVLLVEGNTWGDIFWGRCRGVGQNHLGKLLMRLRSELRIELQR